MLVNVELVVIDVEVDIYSKDGKSSLGIPATLVHRFTR